MLDVVGVFFLEVIMKEQRCTNLFQSHRKMPAWPILGLFESHPSSIRNSKNRFFEDFL